MILKKSRLRAEENKAALQQRPQITQPTNKQQKNQDQAKKNQKKKAKQPQK